MLNVDAGRPVPGMIYLSILFPFGGEGGIPSRSMMPKV